VWGSNPALGDWAAIARRPAESLTAGLGWRVARVWVDEASA
jgi:hypothetical protein